MTTPAKNPTPQVSVMTLGNGPPCLISALWFIFFGWEIGTAAMVVAWFFNITIIGLPVGLFILNHIPFLLFLRPPSSQVVAQTTPTGEVVIEERGRPQINILLRALYFILVGWWFSALWLLVAYLLCVVIVGLPIGLVMFNLTPAVTTLRKY